MCLLFIMLMLEAAVIQPQRELKLTNQNCRNHYPCLFQQRKFIRKAILAFPLLDTDWRKMIICQMGKKKKDNTSQERKPFQFSKATKSRNQNQQGNKKPWKSHFLTVLRRGWHLRVKVESISMCLLMSSHLERDSYSYLIFR